MGRSRVLCVSAFFLLFACGDSEGDGQAGSGGGGNAGNGASVGGSGAAGGDGASGGVGNSAGVPNGGQGGDGGNAGSPGCGIAPTPGTTQEMLEVDGTMRAYTLVIVDSLDGTTPVPLIFGFHGFGGTGEAASNYFGLTGTEPALYVYPQALPLPDQGGGVGWDMQEDGVDVAFIDALVAELADAHCLDTTKVFAAGHSHGASFSNHLGCYRPAMFRAIAPVAGGGPWAGACVGDAVGAMLVHGSNDEDVPIDNGIGSRDHWLDAAGCAGASTMATNPSPCVVYDGCAEPVVWCEHAGGHEWPDFAGDGIRSFFLSF